MGLFYLTACGFTVQLIYLFWVFSEESFALIQKDIFPFLQDLLIYRLKPEKNYSIILNEPNKRKDDQNGYKRKIITETL